MGIVVQKFGGTSVETTENLFNVCKFITKEYDKGNQVIVVVSAQGSTTDRLIKEAKEICEKPDKRELDLLLSAGEQMSSTKLTMCLHQLNYEAISLMGWQIPIKTNDNYGDADIFKRLILKTSGDEEIQNSLKTIMRITFLEVLTDFSR